MPFRPLEHTADVGIEVEAATLDELFAAAARGLLDAMTELDRVELRLARDTRLEARSPDLLLVDWLDELLFRFDAHHELLCEHAVNVTCDDGTWRLVAVSRGEPFDPARHPLKVPVKAITYHGLEVKRSGEGWHARVIFDV
jgi:SHS2 domain-containing protein